MTPLNLFANTLTATCEGEAFSPLLQHKNVIIERIQSPDQTVSKVYRQTQDEWVCLLQGEAELDMDGDRIRLQPGSSCFIPAGTPHQVIYTRGDPHCIWLAVHIY